MQDLLAAWTDWTDLNDLEGINGAEREYYEALDPPYLPRNNPELDSVDELLSIRGFADLFEGIDLDSCVHDLWQQPAGKPQSRDA